MKTLGMKQPQQMSRFLPQTMFLRPVSDRLTPREFNSYGARRGNDAVMTRGTFASIKLLNRFIGKPGPKTLHIPSGQTVSAEARRPAAVLPVFVVGCFSCNPD